MEAIGRQRERERVDRFLDMLCDGPAALVLEGDSGIGKASTGIAESFAAPREARPSYGEGSYRRVVGDDDQVPSDEAAASSHLAKTV